MKHKVPSAWIGIALAFYAFIAIAIAESGLGVLLPSILASYHLTPATVTILFFSQISGYVVAALASSLLSERIGLARMILLAAMSLTSALCIYASTSHWAVMVITGMLLGLGIGLTDAGINTFMAHDQRSANRIGLLHAFYGIGALSGPAIATTLLTLGVSWRSVYWVFAGLVSLLVIGMIWVVVRRYPLMDAHSFVSDQSAESSLRLVLKKPIVLVSGLFLLLYVGTEAAVGIWAYAVQTIARGTPVAVAGYSVAAYWFGLTLGRLLLGFLTKRLGAVRIIDVSLGLLIVGLLVWWLFPHQLWSLPLIGFSLAAVFPMTIWLMPQRVSAPLVPAAIGLLTSLGSVGAVSIPTALGWLANAIGLQIVPMLLLPLAVIMAILHRWLINYAPLQTAEQRSHF
jgi:fucose permease